MNEKRGVTRDDLVATFGEKAVAEIEEYVVVVNPRPLIADIDALTKQCDALRAVAELASNIYAISATFEMNPLVKERLEALQTNARQALAGQPEREELTQLQKGNIERARGVNRLWDKGQPEEGKHD